MAKILIEHRPQAVIVAWDAGMSGRELTYEPYKAQRRPRPDLLSEQWPHLAPLAEAFGFHNVKVEGWEADDVIATLVRHAREAEIPVMVVSGDRDVYQVVERRGSGDDHVARRHRDEGLRPRGGDRALRRPARAGAGPDRAQGRHLRQHPRRPGDRRQDRRPAPAGVRLAGGGAGQRRQDLGREAQAEPHRARRRRPGLEAARDPEVRRSRCRSTSARRRARSPTAAACARWRRSSSCARWSSASTRSSWRTCPTAPSRRPWSSRPRRGRRPTSPTDRSRSPSRPGVGRPATAIGWSPARPRTWSSWPSSFAAGR